MLRAYPVPFRPIVAETSTHKRPILPVAYDWVRLVFLRSGTAIVCSEFGEQPVRPGDGLLLGANVLSGCRPEEPVTTTTVFLDFDYLVDKVFWQHSAALADRMEACELLEEPYVEPAQLLRLSDDDLSRVQPCLDELTQLNGCEYTHLVFFQTERLLLSVLQVVLPYIEVSAVRRSATQRHTTKPSPPRRRALRPLRPEARTAAEMMRSDLARRWGSAKLAETVCLSVPQFHRVFMDAFGKTPQTYLTMLRAEGLARLLRETDLPIEVAMRKVGWNTRGHAARFFRQYLGVTPAKYRELTRLR
ncbi:helix-turn-helix transcriptional regulator [Nesterenkonia populi]|uniref:helix-turn-helix transcriptional regulator n=1 Tax=Nesterenkonia populi TaxID=1591087 RepID=UPI0011BD7A25|nr:AraC family transcriptional regulator [Nesterenkonia populi]